MLVKRQRHPALAAEARSSTVRCVASGASQRRGDTHGRSRSAASECRRPPARQPEPSLFWLARCAQGMAAGERYETLGRSPPRGLESRVSLGLARARPLPLERRLGHGRPGSIPRTAPGCRANRPPSCSRGPRLRRLRRKRGTQDQQPARRRLSVVSCSAGQRRPALIAKPQPLRQVLAASRAGHTSSTPWKLLSRRPDSVIRMKRAFFRSSVMVVASQ